MEETYQIYTRIREITGVPIDAQRLVTGAKHLEDSSILRPWDGTHGYPAVHLLLRLRGGKGGFGSLLRGAATKAGQKKTNNFDACRDMSGRRLRHVNAEKKLEEWKAEAEERRLEKIADDFIKKKVKAVKKGGGSGDADKYVQKYREDSAKCMEEVEKSVREAIGKRKVAAGGADAKRLKIWVGKRTVGDSDSDDMDEDDSNDDEEEENDKSVILDDGNRSDSNKEEEGSSGFCYWSEAGWKIFWWSMVGSESNDDGEPALETHGERTLGNGDGPLSQKTLVSGTEACKTEKQESNQPESGNLEGTVGQPQGISCSGDGGVLDCGMINVVGLNSESKPVVHDETVVAGTDVSYVVKPLNLDEFNSAAELEAIGMERLKSELQSHGLKCGGTLQERAARLFLLKTTPLEMLPKKLLAKK
ncbi:ubiquitin-like superfamily protein [Actinidia rufa]|uniref:Ubiquitin-like superfamily protein n=1 Tax=Actinidia rufa TaxID=165716 RepID=A0A7J0F0Y4_9ERIC|nr:ubiquitin-like superfamily protein [Actinidia rufa]